MSTESFYRQKYDKISFATDSPGAGEYENCEFISCDLSNCDLTGYRFLDCHFTACNLSMAKLVKTVIQGAVFKDCKLLGLNFGNCNQFGLSLSFQNCQLDHCSFSRTKIKKTKFSNCRLHGTDFTEADLSESSFSGCDLLNATFENSILEKVDFTSVLHYIIDPENNKIKNAKFSAEGLPGLLAKYKIQIIG